MMAVPIVVLRSVQFSDLSEGNFKRSIVTSSSFQHRGKRSIHDTTVLAVLALIRGKRSNLHVELLTFLTFLGKNAN